MGLGTWEDCVHNEIKYETVKWARMASKNHNRDTYPQLELVVRIWERLCVARRQLDGALASCVDGKRIMSAHDTVST